MGEKQLNYILNAYERELKKRMEPEEFHEFMIRTSKELFRMDIDDLPEGDFKDFCNEQFDVITQEPDRKQDVVHFSEENNA